MPPGNEPQIVEQAKFRPGKCLASGDTEGPFIDAGRWTREHDPYVQLSVRWVEEQARNLLGMVSQAEVEERYVGLEEKLREQGEKLKALERFEAAAGAYEVARMELVSEPSSAEAKFTPDTAEQIDREAGGVAV